MTDAALLRYKYALSYSKAAKAINARAGSEPELLLPSQVNAALALELYFKSLYYALNNTDFLHKGRHTHDVGRIFDALKSEIKARLEKEFGRRLAGRNMGDLALYERMGISVQSNLKLVLENWSQVFVKFRYAYDLPKSPINALFFPELEGTLIDIIRQLRPNWPAY